MATPSVSHLLWDDSWNAFGLTVNEKIIHDVADAYEKKGLADYGWTYINIDDGWEAANRDAQGKIIGNEKFKNIKALSDYLHSKGLKLGIYSSPGPKTCGSFLGSYQFEEKDAKTYADWGIDYLKYDWCSYSQIAPSPDLEGLQKPYVTMKNALGKQNRDIAYSLCQYGMGEVWKWGKDVGGNCWRTTGDIVDTWGSLQGILKLQEGIESYAGPGHWNDPDMLIVGYVGWSANLHKTRLNAHEQYLHISTWAMLSAPLLLGCDPNQLDEFTLNLITNNEVLSINQDRLGKQASIVKKDGSVWYYAKPLYRGAYAVCAVNYGWAEKEVSITPAAFNISGTFITRDVWRQKNAGGKGEEVKVVVPPHGAGLYKLIPVK